jgi:GT2 family glycosyltransferase
VLDVAEGLVEEFGDMVVVQGVDHTAPPAGAGDQAEGAQDPQLMGAGGLLHADGGGHRITDPDTNVTLRRWVPRLRTTDATRPGIVTVMAEGVVMIRRSAFDAAGGWPGHFFLFHEGIDLAWRLWRQGCRR